MNLILKGYWSNNPISVDEVVQNPEVVLRVPVSMVTLSADVDKAYVDEKDTLLSNEFTTALQVLDDKKANATAVTQVLSTKADLIDGLIPANQLPSFVDDVLNFSGLASFPSLGQSGKIYIAENTNKTYRWGGSSYVEVGDGGVALGETIATAYRGDRGKIAYDHSQSQGNPHNTTTSDIVEGAKLYFTESRVNQTVLTGLNTSIATPALATDPLLTAVGKLQAQVNTQKFNWINANVISGYMAAPGVTVHSATPLKFAIMNGLLWISGAIKISQATTTVPFLRIQNPNYRLKAAWGVDVGYITVTHVTDGDFAYVTQIPVRIVSNNSGVQQGIWLYAQANLDPQLYGNILIFQSAAIGELLTS